MLSVATSVAVPKASAKRELQQLVRLPIVEFGTPLEFHRRFGFVVFPNESMAAREAAQILKESKENNGEALRHLSIARVHDAQGDAPGAMRQYARAIDLFRKRLEVSPEEVRSLAGLGEALVALGRFSEAQSVLERAGSVSDVELWLARARLYRERAWFAAAGEAQRYASGSFLEQLVGIVAVSPEPSRVDDAKRFLNLAEEALTRAFEMEANEVLQASCLLERSAFGGFRNALEAAFSQAQNAELKMRNLRASLFTESSLKDLKQAAFLSDAPSVLAASALAAAVAEETVSNWAASGTETDAYVREIANQLHVMADIAGENAAEAAEYLGCVRLQALKDATGAERGFRQALRLEPGRIRAWELLTLAAVQQGPEEYVEIAEERVEALPQARSSVLLVKSYERSGEILRAELIALNAAGIYPNDWLVNLTLAAMLLKDENAESFLWRVDEAIKKAEKGLGMNPKRQQRVDLVLVKSVFLAMSDRKEEARKLVGEVRPLPAELEEVMRVLGQ
jgi:tetratricopeptide (TPR) repeat protein